jgi:hypothetical protein
MSDFSEVQHGFDILLSFFANKEKNHSLMHWTAASPVLPPKQSLCSKTPGVTFG